MKLLREALKDGWIIIVTAALATFAITYPLSHEPQDIGQLGGWIGGIASAIAFLWLIAGYNLQRRELSLQQEELKLQREALEKQVVEMNEATKVSRETAHATLIAALAAKKSADAAVGIELPVLKAIPVDLVSTSKLINEDETYGGAINNYVPSKYSAVGQIRYQNFGRTPAFPLSFQIGWFVGEQLPSDPNYTKITKIAHGEVIKPALEGYYQVDSHMGFELSSQQIDSLSKGESFLWIYGALTSRDFMGTESAAKFCWRWANRNSKDHSPYYFFESDGLIPPNYVA